MKSKDFKRVAFQNCRGHPQYCKSKNATNGSFARSAGMYSVLTYTEHGLYTPILESKHKIQDRMYVMHKGTSTCLSYSINDGKDTKWNQYGGTGTTLNADMRLRKSQDGIGGDPTKLGRWTWTKDQCGRWHHISICISILSVSQPR